MHDKLILFVVPTEFAPCFFLSHDYGGNGERTHEMGAKYYPFFSYTFWHINWFLKFLAPLLFLTSFERLQAILGLDTRYGHPGTALVHEAASRRW